MSKKTLALIITLIILTIVLLVVAFTTQNKQATPQTQETVTPTPTPIGHTTLMLENSVTQTLGSTSASTVNVVIDTHGDQVTAVQLEIAYDPKVLINMRVTPGTFFATPQVLPVGGVNTQTGRITYMIAPTNIRETQTGTGVVAVLTFNPVRTTGVTETEITLLDKSNVAARGAFGTSVLIERQGTKVIVQPQTTTATGSSL